MSKISKFTLKRLKYTNDSFPVLDWNEFLKNFNVNFYTSRSDRLWYAIRGKGFVIWISSFYPSKDDGIITWYSNLEINKNSSLIGMQVLGELIEGATNVFDKMELEEK